MQTYQNTITSGTAWGCAAGANPEDRNSMHAYARDANLVLTSLGENPDNVKKDRTAGKASM